MLALKQIVKTNARHYPPILGSHIDAAHRVDRSDVHELVGDHLPKVMSCHGRFDARKLHAVWVERFAIIVNVKEISQRWCTFENP